MSIFAMPAPWSSSFNEWIRGTVQAKPGFILPHIEFSLIYLILS